MSLCFYVQGRDKLEDEHTEYLDCSPHIGDKLIVIPVERQIPH